MNEVLSSPLAVSLAINAILSVLVVMLVAALIIRAERAEGSVPPQIALKLASMIPQEYLLSGAQWVDKTVKSDSNPSNDWIGDATVSGANAVVGELQSVSKSPSVPPMTDNQTVGSVDPDAGGPDAS